MKNTDEFVDSTSKVLVSIMMSVSLSNKGKSLKLRHCDISTAYFRGTLERLSYIRLHTEDRRKYDDDKVGEKLRHQQSIFPRNNGETHLHLTFAEERQKHDPSVKSMCETQDASHIWQLGCANYIGGISVSVSSKDECLNCGEQTQCRIVLQSKSRCENGNAG